MLPFFDHRTGDFDCWVDDDAFDVHFFDHETRGLTLVSTSGFVPWFEKVFKQHL